MNPTMADARLISVVTLSARTGRRLRAAPFDAGQVHSVFERALNLDWHDGRLLTLHGPGPLLAPFAAALARFPTDAVRPGQRVRRWDDTITLDGIVVEWSGAATVDVTMRVASEGSRSVTTLLSAFSDVESGSAGLTSTIGRRAQSRLAEGLRLRQSEEFIEGALGMLGLGEGLTPSGDDCLVGALAVVHRFARPWLDAHPEIESVVRTASLTATNAIAREFVTHALAGQFSESLIDLMSAQSAKDIERAATHLLRMGATSGADTLHGIRLALCALRPHWETSA
jgi:Protein of unknown function (DUF2877)